MEKLLVLTGNLDRVAPLIAQNRSKYILTSSLTLPNGQSGQSDGASRSRVFYRPGVAGAVLQTPL